MLDGITRETIRLQDERAPRRIPHVALVTLHRRTHQVRHRQPRLLGRRRDHRRGGRLPVRARHPTHIGPGQKPAQRLRIRQDEDTAPPGLGKLGVLRVIRPDRHRMDQTVNTVQMPRRIPPVDVDLREPVQQLTRQDRPRILRPRTPPRQPASRSPPARTCRYRRCQLTCTRSDMPRSIASPAAGNPDTAYSPRCYAFTRHERLTILAASVGCWLTRPLGVSAVLTLAPRCSPWRLQAAHGYPGSRHGR